MSEPLAEWGETRKVSAGERPIVFHFLPDAEIVYVDDAHRADWEKLLAEKCGVVLSPDATKGGPISQTIGSCSVGLDYCDGH
jgi:hypothetical protein